MSYKFLIATMPIPGHVAPFTPVVRELLRRGHEVVWYGSNFFRNKIEASGARFEPIRSAIDFGDNDYNRHFPERAKLGGLKQVVFDFEHLFVGSIPGMVKDLRAILQHYKADVLLGDPAVAAMRVLSDKDGYPAATLNITVMGLYSRDLAAFGLGLPFNNSLLGRIRNRLSYWLVDHVVFRSVNRAYRRLAKQHDWQVLPFRPTASKFLQLQPMVPSFEYPITDLPPQVHYIGALLPDLPRDVVLPKWWQSMLDSGRPIVLVTQGTIATNSDELIRPSLLALADENVWVIAATSNKRADELDFAIPDNARVEPFVPFVAIMQHVALYITNGGYGGISIALTHGVPVISAGTTEDKMEVGNRVAYSGVGINLKTNVPTVEQVRDAVREVMGNSRYAQRAKAIQADLAKQDAAGSAAGLLEELARTQRPVTRLPA